MLKRWLSALLTAACIAALAASTSAPGAEKAPPKKNWETLRDKPVDYAPYERRRAENLKLGTTPVNAAFAGGFAKASDLGQAQPWVITDEALIKGLAERAKKLLPETMGIKAPPMEFVVYDDLGFLSAARATGRGHPAIEVLLNREAEFFAKATDGGALVLGLSVLKIVRSFDELDFVIGHEMSHILYDHHTEEEEMEKIGQAIQIVALIASLATQRSDLNTQQNVGIFGSCCRARFLDACMGSGPGTRLGCVGL
jgi:predicted Zn-dependent protease